MKNADIFNKLGKLSIKYANRGLYIDIEFNRFGMIFKGWLDMTLSNYDVYQYNREYSYDLINHLSDTVDIEYLVDEFKREVFEEYKKHISGKEKE